MALFASGHGKRVVDGIIGGTVKASVWRHVKCGEDRQNLEAVPATHSIHAVFSFAP